MNLYISTPLICLIVALLAHCGEFAKILSTENTTSTTKVGNSELKCYRWHCNEPPCDNPLQAPNLLVERCSEVKSPKFTDQEDINVAYTCVKLINKRSTELGCSLNKVDNKGICDVFKDIEKAAESLVNVFLHKLAHLRDKPQKNKTEEDNLRCSTCDTDLCNTV